MIQAVIFDMGGVLVDEQPSRHRLAEFDRLLGWESGTMVQYLYSGPLWQRVSRGETIKIATILMCFAGVFVYCWFAGLGRQYLFIGVVNAVAAIWYLGRIRLIKGRKLSGESESQG